MSDRFELPDELTIYSAPQVREALLAWVAEQTKKAKDTLEVSAAAVAEIDGAGLQLLASLANLDQNLKLIDPSSALINACNTLGLSGWLKDTGVHA
jgi:ABC-type transporter Mla MlaB component